MGPFHGMFDKLRAAEAALSAMTSGRIEAASTAKRLATICVSDENP